MTADQSQISNWLQKQGFVDDPFGYPRAEKPPDKDKDMLQLTYVPDSEFKELALEPEQSVVFLAPYGGGKTAAREYTRFLWETDHENTLVAIYKDFTVVAESLPYCRLRDHADPLMRAILVAVEQKLKQNHVRYRHLSERDQLWWLKMYATYASGGLDDLMRVHITLSEFIRQSRIYKEFQSTEDKRPFREQVSLEDMFERVVEQCGLFRFDKLLILVDEVDNYSDNEQVVEMQKMLKPLFRTSSIYGYKFITWKFFVPEDLRSFVEKTKAQRGHAITTHSIKWGDERLKKFLKNRLEWASKGEISSLNDMTADDQALALIDLDKVFIETILTSEVLKKERGIPRTLLLLGKGLFRIAEKKNEPLITKVVWDTFVNEATHRNWVFRIWQGLVIFYRKLREVTPKSGFEV